MCMALVANADVRREPLVRAVAERPSMPAVILPPLAVIGIGTIVGVQIRGASYPSTIAETFAGTVAGLPIALFLDVLDQSPCIKGQRA